MVTASRPFPSLVDTRESVDRAGQEVRYENVQLHTSDLSLTQLPGGSELCRHPIIMSPTCCLVGQLGAVLTSLPPPHQQQPLHFSGLVTF